MKRWYFRREETLIKSYLNYLRLKRAWLHVLEREHQTLVFIVSSNASPSAPPANNILITLPLDHIIIISSTPITSLSCFIIVSSAPSPVTIMSFLSSCLSSFSYPTSSTHAKYSSSQLISLDFMVFTNISLVSSCVPIIYMKPCKINYFETSIVLFLSYCLFLQCYMDLSISLMSFMLD